MWEGQLSSKLAARVFGVGRANAAAVDPGGAGACLCRTRPVSGMAVVGMTQQYLAGELSVLLARLQAVATDDGCAREVARLRRVAETQHVWTLSGVERWALELADTQCWGCLAQGEAATVERLATVGAQLREFGVCSGLLPDD
jgi:hypothetical protein